MALINKLYKTKIDAEEYNMTIDNNYVITVTLIDFNNQPVSNQNVTITCDKGNFYQGEYNAVYRQEHISNTIGENFIEIHFNKLAFNQELSFTMISNSYEYPFNTVINDSQDLENGIYYLYFGNNHNISEIKDIHLNPIIENNILYTGVNPTSVSTSKSITTTTKSDGSIDVLYSADEWGLVTFSANNNTVNAYVSGWREIELRKDIEYSVAPTEFTNNNPFKQVIIRYDDSIHKMNLTIFYQNTKTYSFPYDSATIWLYFYTTDDEGYSKLPPHIFNMTYIQVRKFFDPAIVYYIASNPLRLNIRVKNDYSNSQTINISANEGITFFLEKDYDYTDGVI